MVFTTLTAKWQAKVPKAVPNAWGLNCGALSSWELNNQSLRIGVMAPLDVSHLSGLSCYCDSMPDRSLAKIRF